MPVLIIFTRVPIDFQDRPSRPPSSPYLWMAWSDHISGNSKLWSQKIFYSVHCFSRDWTSSLDFLAKSCYNQWAIYHVFLLKRRSESNLDTADIMLVLWFEECGRNIEINRLVAFWELYRGTGGLFLGIVYLWK